ADARRSVCPDGPLRSNNSRIYRVTKHCTRTGDDAAAWHRTGWRSCRTPPSSQRHTRLNNASAVAGASNLDFPVAPRASRNKSLVPARSLLPESFLSRPAGILWSNPAISHFSLLQRTGRQNSGRQGGESAKGALFFSARFSVRQAPPDSFVPLIERNFVDPRRLLSLSS